MRRQRRKAGMVIMMETLFELRATTSDFCRVFDFFEDANKAMSDLVAMGRFLNGELYISRVVTE